MLERIDFVFSYWILFWYFCYELNIIKFNPTGALYLGLFANTGILLLMIYYKNTYNHVLLFFSIVLVQKVLPLWNLRNTNYSLKEIYFFFVYFLVYVAWLHFNNSSFYSIVINQVKNIREKKSFGPVMLQVLKK